MRVLVTWASERGGTDGIGRMVADTLNARGFDVVAAPVDEVTTLDGFSGVIIGGALYANLWPPRLRRFINRHVAELRRVPVWLFSSGPLDVSADETTIPATRQVEILAERIGAKGHVTFGGRLEPAARGFPAAAMAKSHSGDWRNPERIQSWAGDVARALPTATPGAPVPQPARSLASLLVSPAIGWAICAVLMGALLASRIPPLAALVIHGVAAPMIFAALAFVYFRNRGAREPLPTAIVWTVVVMALDAVVVAGLVQRSPGMFTSTAGTWLVFGLIFVTVWMTGWIVSMTPAR